VPLRDLQKMRLLANRTRHVVLLDDAEFLDVRLAKEVRTSRHFLTDPCLRWHCQP
jgi:hypothetical protein